MECISILLPGLSLSPLYESPIKINTISRGPDTTDIRHRANIATELQAISSAAKKFHSPITHLNLLIYSASSRVSVSTC